jgi:hypothetical protein
MNDLRRKNQNLLSRSEKQQARLLERAGDQRDAQMFEKERLAELKKSLDAEVNGLTELYASVNGQWKNVRASILKEYALVMTNKASHQGVPLGFKTADGRVVTPQEFRSASFEFESNLGD